MLEIKPVKPNTAELDDFLALAQADLPAGPPYAVGGGRAGLD